MPRYKIESTGNGASFTVARLADGALLTFAGDDAIQFDDELDGTHDRWTDDDVCDQYSELFQAGSCEFCPAAGGGCIVCRTEGE